MMLPHFKRRLQRRRAVAGVLSALIMFAMIFTAGAGFFLTVNQLRHQADAANAQRQSFQQQAALENLTLIGSVSPSNHLYLAVSNTGGVTSSIVDVFVTGTDGKFLSSAASGSHFLSKSPDLNVTLPLSLGLGASTSMMGGCGSQVGCDIGINDPSIYSPGETVLLNVLTALGNVFSIPYPAPHGTLENVVIVNQDLITQELYGDTQVNYNNQTVVIECYECFTNLAAGGNILVTQLTAIPSPVPDGGTITVTATVWNYSPYTASKVNVTLSDSSSGFAYVTPNIALGSGPCGSPTNIPTQGHTAFTCTFTAHAGGSNGAITFTGSSEGCIQTGNTTTCANGALAQSSIASSNPVQVGVVVSFGPWQLNYYYFTYTDTTHTTKGSPAVVTGSDDDAAFYVRLTNIYGSPLTILDGSYLQFVSPGTDVDEFVVQSVSYSPVGITPYGCSDSPPAVPSDSVLGQTCTTVDPGGTIELTFAAKLADSSSWEWASSNPGGASGVGCTVQIIIEYALGSGGTYSIYAQDLPFQSVYIQ